MPHFAPNTAVYLKHDDPPLKKGVAGCIYETVPIPDGTLSYIVQIMLPDSTSKYYVLPEKNLTDVPLPGSQPPDCG